MKKRDLIVVAITVLVMCVPMAIIAHRYQHVAHDLSSKAIAWDTVKVTPTKTGERRQFLQGPTTTLDELECHVSTLRPGEISHAPHQHPEDEMMIVKEGTVEVLVAGEWKTVGPGSLIFEASNQLHNIKNVGQTPATYFAIKWKSLRSAK